MRLLVCFALGLWALTAGLAPSTFENLKALALDSGKLQLVVLEQGASMASLKLAGSPLNALWDPAAAARQAGVKNVFGASLGHFLCVDGFGGVSPEETAAGYPFHGEASTRNWSVVRSADSGGVQTLEMTTELPLAHEKVTRTYRLAAGEQAVLVETEIENLLAFDRPLQWAEHATIGAPFLEPGVTVVDMSATQARVRPYGDQSAGFPHRLAAGREFTWPNAPLETGGAVDLRAAPLNPNSTDHTTQRMAPGRPHVFVTALNPRLHLLIGWIFQPDEFPWTQSWEYYPRTGEYARGLEFSTQAFDVPRRQVVSENSLFGTPLYRWLPARSKVRAHFVLFLTAVPDGFLHTDEAALQNGRILIEDRHSHKSASVAISVVE